MLALGDALAVALMERKGFSADQYRDLHPGGSLGRALIRVADLMHRGAEIPLAREEASMRDVLLTMASERRFGCVGVTDEKGASDADRHHHRWRPVASHRRQGFPGKSQGLRRS